MESRNFIEQIIDKDLAEGVYDTVHTRFPPEPNGYLHIGHAKIYFIKLRTGKGIWRYSSICVLMIPIRPRKRSEFVDSIHCRCQVAGCRLGGSDLFFASNYFDQMYEAAVKLIKKGKAYVSDLTAERDERIPWNTYGTG